MPGKGIPIVHSRATIAMLDSYWRGSLAALLLGAILVIIAGWLGWGLGVQSEKRLQADRYASEHAEGTNAYINSSCIGLNQSDSIACIRDAIKADHEDTRSEYDLAAQEQMAWWTMWMLFTSVITVLVTAVGIFYVRHTLRAALHANSMTERTAIIEQRAWLSYDGGA